MQNPLSARSARDAPATPPNAVDHHQAAQGHHPPHQPQRDYPVSARPPPEEPPPSYDDATHSSTSPLLLGPPPAYGAFRTYVDPDESSEASSDVDDTEQYMPEPLRQALALFILVGILYTFWSINNQPDLDGFVHGYA